MATRMAVAAEPNEMALALVEDPRSVMEEAPSSRASPDGVAAAASPVHGLDCCPAKLLMAIELADRSLARTALPVILARFFSCASSTA